MGLETQAENRHELTIPALLITPSMHLLKSRYGFDTLAERRSCVELAQLAADSRVLDVGTGSGWMAIVAACAGHHVVSVDVDHKALLGAENKAKQCGDAVAARIEFKEASATRLPFEDEQFDGVFSFETVHHLPDCSTAFAEIWRVTRGGGRIVIADLNEPGLKAVRETSFALNSGAHEENSCQLPVIERMLSSCASVERHDLNFVGVFVARKDAPCRKLDVTAEVANRVLSEARRRLDDQSHFHGRADSIQLDYQEGSLILTGRVPSYYLKQLIQESLKGVVGVNRIINDVEVICSAASRAHRCSVK